jgi:hypothetical protein
VSKESPKILEYIVRTAMNKHADEIFNKAILLEKEAQFEKAKSTYEDILHHATDETIL